MLEQVPLDRLRLRQSAKWAKYPPDVLPAWVAEMDFDLAPPVAEALRAAVELGDTGYPELGRLPEAFAGFAEARFGWNVDPARVWLVADVMSGVAELLRALTEPGDAVVVNTPIYPPFVKITEEVGRRIVEAPLARGPDGWELDLDALEQAFAAGARVYLFCHPHNPTGRSFSRSDLAAVSALAARYGVIVISDEVHAPLTMPGSEHVPYLALGGEAVEHGIAILAASKAFNLAGLKCAAIVTASDRVQDELTVRLSKFLGYHAGHLGVLAAIAAFEEGGPWLDALVDQLDRNRNLLGRLLEEQLPEVVYVPPQAGYLAWLDCTALDLGDDPSVAFLERGRVALSPGPSFGTQGNGFARLNFGTSEALLTEAVRRMAVAVS